MGDLKIFLENFFVFCFVQQSVKYISSFKNMNKYMGSSTGYGGTSTVLPYSGTGTHFLMEAYKIYIRS